MRCAMAGVAPSDAGVLLFKVQEDCHEVALFLIAPETA